MASFYGSVGAVTASSISNALGYTPVLYTLSRDEDDEEVLILKEWRQPIPTTSTEQTTEP